MTDENYKNTRGSTQEFIDAYSIELDNLKAYGEELKAAYPDRALYIDEQILKIFDTRNSIMLTKLTRSNKEETTNRESPQHNPLENRE